MKLPWQRPGPSSCRLVLGPFYSKSSVCLVSWRKVSGRGFLSDIVAVLFGFEGDLRMPELHCTFYVAGVIVIWAYSVVGSIDIFKLLSYQTPFCVLGVPENLKHSFCRL